MPAAVEARLIAAWHAPLAPLGPGVFAGLAVLLFTVAGVACLVPARAAIGLPPMAVLRRE